MIYSSFNPMENVFYAAAYMQGYAHGVNDSIQQNIKDWFDYVRQCQDELFATL